MTNPSLSLIDAGPPAPCPVPFNLAAHAMRHAPVQGDKPALEIIGGAAPEVWTYARMEAAILGTGAGLLARGVAPGDPVLMRIGNTVDFPLAYLGCIAAGLIPVPTSAQLTVGEVDKIAAEIAPALILAAPGVAVPQAPYPTLTTAELATFRTLPPCAYAMDDPDRLAYMIYTSGTSGRPRAVMHAHRALWARHMMHDGWEGVGPTDRLLHAGAFNWTYTLGTGLLDPWTCGATALIPAEGVGAEALGGLLATHNATIFAAAPGVFRQMLRAPLPPLPHLRHGLSAGEKLPDVVRAGWEGATGTAVHEALGMSECSTFISASPARPATPGTSGFPQPGRRIAVLGPDHAPVPRGAPGTLAICARDPGLFLGYFGQPQETAAKFFDGWFLTGDTVAMDGAGAITYLGRDDDMMNAGGFRVSPLEVERAMNTCPGIAETAAAEVEVRPGTSVIACFYAAPAPVDDATLAAHATKTLARYKQPRLFIHVPAIPKGANNKLQRRALRMAHAAGAFA